MNDPADNFDYVRACVIAIRSAQKLGIKISDLSPEGLLNWIDFLAYAACRNTDPWKET